MPDTFAQGSVRRHVLQNLQKNGGERYANFLRFGRYRAPFQDLPKTRFGPILDAIVARKSVCTVGKFACGGTPQIARSCAAGTNNEKCERLRFVTRSGFNFEVQERI